MFNYEWRTIVSYHQGRELVVLKKWKFTSSCDAFENLKYAHIIFFFSGLVLKNYKNE